MSEPPTPTPTPTPTTPEIVPAAVMARFLVSTIATATTMTNEETLQFVWSKPQQTEVAGLIKRENWPAIIARGPTVAAHMDAVLGQYGIRWDSGPTMYNFLSSQRAAMYGVPVEDINSTRKYCVRPAQLSVEQMLSNLAGMASVIGRQTGLFAAATEGKTKGGAGTAKKNTTGES